VEVGVGGGVHEVDGVGDAVFAGELYGVEVVAERFAEGQGIFFYSLQQLLVVLGSVEHIAVRMWAARIVGHDADFGLADDVAAEVFLEVNCGLEGHAEIAGVVVGVEELVAVVDVIDVAPAAAVVGFEKGGKADVVEDAVPVEGKLEVAQGALINLRGEFFVGEENGLGDGDAEFGGKGEVEKFVVGGPPEGIVDDLCSSEDGTNSA